MKIWQKSVASTTLLGLMLLLAMGSEPYHTNTTNRSIVPIEYGTLQEGIRIVAEDGSFEINGGERFQSPFQNNLWNGTCGQFRSNLLLNQAQSAINCGARKVRVYVEGKDTPLYGLLALNSSIAAAYGPASRSYQIKIAPDKIQHADSGNTSVSYEMVKWKATGYWDDGRRTSSENNYFTWILWLSAYPY